MPIGQASVSMVPRDGIDSHCWLERVLDMALALNGGLFLLSVILSIGGHGDVSADSRAGRVHDFGSFGRGLSTVKLGWLKMGKEKEVGKLLYVHLLPCLPLSTPIRVRIPE
jgi:hypothetical protein